MQATFSYNVIEIVLAQNMDSCFEKEGSLIFTVLAPVIPKCFTS